MSNDWKIGSVVFNATTGQPVPLQTSQGGKPYNLEFIRGLEERIARLTEERDRLRDEVGRLREALEHMLKISFLWTTAPGERLEAIRDNLRAALAPAEGTEGT